MRYQAVVAAAAVAGLLGAVGVLGRVQKTAAPRPRAELLPYQAPVSGLSFADQQRFARIRAQIDKAEKQRAAARQWPTAFPTDEGIAWTYRRHGLYVNYLGIPVDRARPRWLVLVIEPGPVALPDPPAPEDEEHHTLSDGTALHVTVWTTLNEGPEPAEVQPFPAAEGWTQRLAR